MMSMAGMADMADMAGMVGAEVTTDAESENASPTSSPQALEATRAVIRDVAGLDRPPDPAAELERDLHLSSFDMIAVCVELEERLGASTDFGKVARTRTVEELSRCWEG